MRIAGVSSVTSANERRASSAPTPPAYSGNSIAAPPTPIAIFARRLIDLDIARVTTSRLFILLKGWRSLRLSRRRRGRRMLNRRWRDRCTLGRRRRGCRVLDRRRNIGDRWGGNRRRYGSLPSHRPHVDVDDRIVVLDRMPFARAVAGPRLQFSIGIPAVGPIRRDTGGPP